MTARIIIHTIIAIVGIVSCVLLYKSKNFKLKHVCQIIIPLCCLSIVCCAIPEIVLSYYEQTNNTISIRGILLIICFLTFMFALIGTIETQFLHNETAINIIRIISLINLVISCALGAYLLITLII